MAKSPILGGFSKSRAPGLSANEAFNLIVEIVETKDGKAPGALMGTDGLDLVGTLGAGPIRGVHVLNDVLYVVSGPQVWSVSPNGISTLCGTIGAVSTPVSMFDNGLQLLILDGVGAWLVPGGYPLTGGAINGAGGLYAVGDTITLAPTGATQSSFPILTVSAISGNPTTSFTLPNKGTSYTTATAAATTPIASQAGAGTGLTLTTTATGGPLTAATVHAGGTGYAVHDTGKISGGTGDAVYRVTSVSSGVVTGIMILNPGTNFASASAAATVAGPGAPSNVGVGLTINITAAGGPISAFTVASGGSGFVVGNVGTINGGSGDATYLVTGIGLTGAVTGFTITQPGSLYTTVTAFTQQSTSGSGANFTLQSPTFGAFVGLVPVTMPFANPTMGGISDGFGVAIFSNSENIAQSDELDLSTWQALDYGVENQSPDKNISLFVIHDEAYILKEKSTSVWVDGGLSGFAFQPMTGVHMEYGCAAPFSPAKAGEQLFWLAGNDQGQGLVVRASAYQIEPISTQALVSEFAAYPTIGDAIGYARQSGGHVFYVLTFPQADKTWVYDVTASQMAGVPIWSRLASFSTGQWHRHWGNCFTPWAGSIAGNAISAGQGVLGDYQSGNLYAFNPATLTDNGTARRWMRRWRALPAGSPQAKRFWSLLINMQTGVGVPNGTTPHVALKWSDDGGLTWSDERIVAVGALGATTKSVKFNRLGAARRFSGSDRIFELSSSDQFSVAIYDAELDVT